MLNLIHAVLNPRVWGLIETGWTLEVHDQTKHVNGSRPIEVVSFDESAS